MTINVQIEGHDRLLASDDCLLLTEFFALEGDGILTATNLLLLREPSIERCRLLFTRHIKLVVVCGNGRI